MIYTILAVAFMLTSGVLIANYELKKTRRDRIRKLRKRARRGIRINP